MSKYSITICNVYFKSRSYNIMTAYIFIHNVYFIYFTYKINIHILYKLVCTNSNVILKNIENIGIEKSIFINLLFNVNNRNIFKNIDKYDYKY